MRYIVGALLSQGGGKQLCHSPTKARTKVSVRVFVKMHLHTPRCICALCKCNVISNFKCFHTRCSNVTAANITGHLSSKTRQYGGNSPEERQLRFMFYSSLLNLDCLCDLLNV